VAAMDVLAPGIGEIIGGSQREERLAVLDARMDELKVHKEAYGWYRDLRRYGTVPHAGFGLRRARRRRRRRRAQRRHRLRGGPLPGGHAAARRRAGGAGGW